MRSVGKAETCCEAHSCSRGDNQGTYLLRGAQLLLDGAVDPAEGDL